MCNIKNKPWQKLKLNCKIICKEDCNYIHNMYTITLIKQWFTSHSMKNCKADQLKDKKYRKDSIRINLLAYRDIAYN